MSQGVKVLMAEDNDINRKLAQLLFKRHNLEVDMVTNGQEAVDQVNECNYDLILMDIEMPVLNGIEATKKIKSALGTKAPKIVALTAHTMESDRENFLAEGLDEVLSKPIEISALQKIIAELA